MTSRYDIDNNFNAFIVYLIHPFVIAGCLGWAFEEGYISLNDLSINYDGNLFSINTVINILALFGLLAYRIELGKLWFNLCSTINNFLLFIPYLCLLFFMYCVFAIPTLLIGLISASWGYEDPIDNHLIQEWGVLFDGFLSTINKFNGIREAIE